MVQINWTHQAVFDLKEIKDYISRDSVFYAKKTIEKIQRRTQVLKIHPHTGKIITEIKLEKFREINEGNFRILYKIVNENRIDILSVFHSARNLITESIL